MRVTELDFDLPADRIAQEPVTPRDASRLLVLDRERGTISHRVFADLPDVLAPGDLLVLNDTKVAPFRLPGRKPTGGRVELLLVRRCPDGDWEALVKGIQEGTVLFDGADAQAVVRNGPEERKLVRFSCDAEELLKRIGRIPLPPYIRRPDDDRDRERYQTVYARNEGAVAAPTAGLHFTTDLLTRLRQRGVALAWITLHVGPGTFRPIRAEEVGEHRMDEEDFEVPLETAEAISAVRGRGGRVVAVGTTVTRTLESLPLDDGRIVPGRGTAGLFVYPGYRFRLVGGIVTNFHLPRSTPLFLAAAFTGTAALLGAYREAVREGYRFYSYGDAMVIL